MRDWLRALKHYFDPPQSGEVTYRYYIRSGNCHQCGQCCSGISLIHNDEVIADRTHFAQLQERVPDYRHFEVIDETEVGLKFRCTHLQPDNSCGIYENRPTFCKKYPSEATMIFGGGLAPNCGYLLKPRHRFKDILSRAARRKSRGMGRLLNAMWSRPQSFTQTQRNS